MVLVTSCGMKKFFKITVEYPALFLAPVFSFWTIGNSNVCCTGHHENKIQVSFKLTYGNAILTSIVNLGLLLAHYLKTPGLVFGDDGQEMTENMKFHIASCSCLIMSWVTLIILQNVQKCQKLCCSCCQENCFPVIQKTTLDIDDHIDVIEDLSKLEHIEMGATEKMIKKERTRFTI